MAFPSITLPVRRASSKAAKESAWRTGDLSWNPKWLSVEMRIRNTSSSIVRLTGWLTGWLSICELLTYSIRLSVCLFVCCMWIFDLLSFWIYNIWIIGLLCLPRPLLSMSNWKNVANVITLYLKNGGFNLSWLKINWKNWFWSECEWPKILIL